MKYYIKDGTLYMIMDDDITPIWWGGISYTAVKNALVEHEGKFTTAEISINSNGGSVTEGMAIRSALLDIKSKGIPVNIKIAGVAASIASVIALSGTTIEMAVGSYIMIHRPYTMTMGDYEEHENTAKTLKTMYSDLVTIYQEKSNATEENIKMMVDSETWIPAADALAMGFATSILTGEAQNSIRGLKDTFMARTFKNIPENLTSKIIEIPNEPVPAEPQSKGNAMDELTQFLASNHVAKAAHEKAIADAKAAVTVAPVATVAQPTADLTAKAMAVATGNDYPNHIRALAGKALVAGSSEVDKAVFNAMVADFDARTEQARSVQAQAVTAETTETPAVVQDAPTTETETATKASISSVADIKARHKIA